MAEIAELRQLRGAVKARLTKLNKFVNDPTKSADQIKIRMTQIDDIYEKYNGYHQQLILAKDDSAELNEDFDEFEDIYFTLKMEHTDILKKMENRNDDKPAFQPAKIPVKLPDIKLKTFNGDWDQWIVFRNNFVSLIHKRQDLDNIQKFTYLQGVLEGDVARMIEKISLTDEGYVVAWDAVKNRYDNNRSIVEHHIHQLLKTQPVKAGSAIEIQSLIDTFANRVGELKQLGQPVVHWDMILVSVLSSCLDSESRKAWEFELGSKEFPTFEKFKTFLNDRAQILRNIQHDGHQSTSTSNSSSKPSGRPTAVNKQPNKQRSSKSFVTGTQKGTSANNTNKKTVCIFCDSADHYKLQCEVFLKKSADDRMKLVNELKLCVNCFRKGHDAEQCESRSCKLCENKHNTLLHVFFDKQMSTSLQPIPSSVNHASSECESSAALHASTHTQVLLSTAVVFIKDIDGSFHKCRILLDSASQLNFITTALADQLRLKKQFSHKRINGLDDMNTNIKFKVSTDIKSRIDDSSFFIELLVVPKITSLLPSSVIKIQDLIPSHIQMADPEFNTPGKIDALIGGELFLQCIKDGRILLERDHLVLQNSCFGFIVGGKVTTHQTFTCLDEPNSIQDELHQLVKQFWELEAVNSNKLQSSEEMACEEHFTKTFYRTSEGRYGVRLPFRPNVQPLGDSMQIAKRRFNYLENKLQKHDELKVQYTRFMDEYLLLNHMTPLSCSQSNSSSNLPSQQYVLPHHAVFKPSSTTTKLRVVFDASAKSTGGNSLNDVLMVGPTIQNDLFSIVLRFRRHRYAFTADIEKMYRMIEVHPDDRKFQRILWRQSPDDQLQTYELNTVTYGTSCAPFLATRVLKQIAIDEASNFPLAADAIEDFYMDDVMTGADDLQTASMLLTQLNQMLQSAGMALRKYCSNSNDLLNLVPEANREVKINDFVEETSQPIKTLGLIWDTNTDQFRIDVKCPELTTTITKRAVLSKIAGIFDPLGIVGPVITQAKIFLQQLWVLHIDWDDPLPKQHQEFWQEYCKQLPLIRDIQLSRCVTPANTSSYELHGFCDASQSAYGAVIYIRCIDDNNQAHTNILCSKSKVAPLKKVTIPRLELCGAVLLTRLVERVVTAMKIKFQKIYLWCDSTIVLNWIDTPSNQLKTFVGNRVSEIQNLEIPVKWLHIDTKSNPADFISRGLMPCELQHIDLWFHGPANLDSLISKSSCPELSPNCDDFHQEFNSNKNSVFVSKADVTTNDFKTTVIEKYSEFPRLVNAVAYVNRFTKNCRSSKWPKIKSSFITVKERLNSIHTITRIVQQQHFAAEFRTLSKNGVVDSKSQLRNLNPFIDDNQLIRVGGRISKSHLTYAAKHPLILPKDDHFTNVIFRYFHKINLHCGAQALLNNVRQQFWPIQGKTVAKRITHQCITCFKAKPKIGNQLMGELPKDRVLPNPPFNKCGVDYCGPFLTATNARRTTTYKSYVAIFICFVTKAIHCEVVAGLTMDAFLASLKRFAFRRGKPEEINSDNGTNFVGAANEIHNIQMFFRMNNGLVKRYCASQGIVWNFSPPRSPHFGGLWEAGVKSFKHHFRRVAHQQVMTFEELLTLSTQIEGCLNSRPLVPLSDDPNDYESLTPGHFLIGRPITAIPEREERSTVTNTLKHWRQIARMHQLFWQRWSVDYLNTMQRRSKWLTPQGNLNLNDLVLVKQDGLPSCKWLMGRVTKLYRGADGMVRVATLSTQNGSIVRAIHKLCPFPKEPVNQTDNPIDS